METKNLKGLQLTQQKSWKPEDNGISLMYLKNNYQCKFPFTAKVSFKKNGEIKAFSDTQRQKGVVTNRATLQDLLRKSVSSRQMEQMRTRANEGDRDADTCW